MLNMRNLNFISVQSWTYLTICVAVNVWEKICDKIVIKFEMS